MKTNAMRLLDQAKIPYEELTYQIDASEFSGEKVSELLNVDKEACYKTLALKYQKELFILVIPVSKELDLKKSAKAVGVKSLEMVKVKDLLNEVGYTRGSVTPIGIKKNHKVYFHSSVISQEEIEISGGKMGISLKVNKEALLRYLKAEVKDLCQ